MQNGIRTTISQHIKAMDELGGLDMLGSSKADTLYLAGSAWAGRTPDKGTKLHASYFGGTGRSMAVSWPKLPGCRNTNVDLVEFILNGWDRFIGCQLHHQVFGRFDHSIDPAIG